MDDPKRSFEALRAHDRASAPPFARMKAEAERRAQRRKKRNGAIFAAAFAAAAVALLAIWVSQPEPEAAPQAAVQRPAESLVFLMDPPSASVVSAVAPIDQIGEAW